MGPPPPWQGMVCITVFSLFYFAILYFNFVLPSLILNAYSECDTYTYPLRDLKYKFLVINSGLK